MYEVHALNDDEKSEAMRVRATERGFELSAEVQAYVLRHGRRDLPSLLGLVDLLDRRSLEAQRPVTLALARDVLAGVQSTIRPAQTPAQGTMASAPGGGAIAGD